MTQARIGWRSNTGPSINYLLASISTISNPILDSYTNASAAFSLRKLSATYSGSAVRVRRSSDNTEQNIGFDASGNLDTTSLLSFVGAGNGFVTTWFDQSGNEKHATQTTASRQPSIVISGVVNTKNSRSAIKFNGNGIYLAALGITTAIKSSFTVFNKDTANWGGPIGGQAIYPSPWKYRNNGNSTIPYSNEKSGLNGVGGSNNVGQGDPPFPSYIYANSNKGSLTTGSSTLALPNATGLNLISYFVPDSQPGTKNIGIGVDPYDIQNWGLIGSVSEIIFFPTDLIDNLSEIRANINGYYSIYTQDTNPTTHAAYSFRKVQPDYTGNAFRLRRSTDNAEIDIPFVNGFVNESYIQDFVGYHNLALHSDSMTNVGSVWNYLNGGVNGHVLTLNSETAPDGTMTASKITDSTAWNNAKCIAQNNPTISQGQSWNSSVHFKMTGSTAQTRYISLCNSNTTASSVNDIYVVFDLQNKVVTDSNFSSDINTGYSIDELDNGWLRCSMWGTFTQATPRKIAKVIRGTNNGPNFTYSAYRPSISNDLYIWGFQYTQGVGTQYLDLKPYTKTTTLTSGQGYLVTWYDQSRNSRNIGQVTANRQSAVMTDGFFNYINGKLSTYFGGGGIGTFNLAIPDLDTTISMIFKLSSSYVSTTEYQLLGGGTYDNQSKLSIKNNKYFLSNSNSSAVGASSVGTVTTNPVISTLIYSTVDKLRINGNEVISADVGGFNLSTNITVGSGYMSRNFLGNIAEIIVWYNSPKGNVVGNIESYMNTYYSIY